MATYPLHKVRRAIDLTSTFFNQLVHEFVERYIYRFFNALISQIRAIFPITIHEIT